LRRTLWAILLLVALGTTVLAILLARTEVPTPNDLATSEATVVYYADGKTKSVAWVNSTRRSVP